MSELKVCGAFYKSNCVEPGISDDELLRRFVQLLSVEDLPPPPNVKRSKSETVSASSEVEVKTKLYYYAVTFTTKLDIMDELLYDYERFIGTRMIKIVNYTIGRELTEEGRPHFHLLVVSENPIYVSDVRKLKLKGRFEVKKLKTKADIQRWSNYVTKGERMPIEKDIKYFSDKGLTIVEKIVI